MCWIPVLLFVVPHLGDHVHRIAGDPARAPHLRIRAERALIGAPARRQHRHRAHVDRLHPVAVRQVFLQRHPIPVGPGDLVDRRDATPGRRFHRPALAVSIRDPLDQGGVAILQKRVKQVDDGLLTLAQNAEVDLGTTAQQVLPFGRDVLSADDDGQARMVRTQSLDDAAVIQPLAREHAVDANQVRRRGHAIRELLGRQPLDQVRQVVQRRELVHRLAQAVNRGDLVTRRAQGSAEVGQRQRRRGRGHVQCRARHDLRRADQRDVPGLSRPRPRARGRAALGEPICECGSPSLSCKGARHG